MKETTTMARERDGRAGGRSLIRRADTAQGGSGAGALFARLDALDEGTETRQILAAELLDRWTARVRAGVWSAEIAALIAQAEALERALDEGGR
jgi:hypothetical protein